MIIKAQFARALALIAVCAAIGTAALAQTHPGGSFTLRVPHVVPVSPILALIAGILILIFPRILNYVVAIYLIVIGLLGIIGR